MIEQIVAYNKKFVEEKGYEQYLTSKYPDKKLAIIQFLQKTNCLLVVQ